ncbi:MAG: hypothetical protein PHF35_04215 [Candidatus Moranbacteria bacterium]|nr:hypothetical protein [Candidatus Moranbacteria bacterium]
MGKSGKDRNKKKGGIEVPPEGAMSADDPQEVLKMRKSGKVDPVLSFQLHTGLETGGKKGLAESKDEIIDPENSGKLQKQEKILVNIIEKALPGALKRLRGSIEKGLELIISNKGGKIWLKKAEGKEIDRRRKKSLQDAEIDPEVIKKYLDVVCRPEQYDPEKFVQEIIKDSVIKKSFAGGGSLQENKDFRNRIFHLIIEKRASAFDGNKDEKLDKILENLNYFGFFAGDRLGIDEQFESLDDQGKDFIKILVDKYHKELREDFEKLKKRGGQTNKEAEENNRDWYIENRMRYGVEIGQSPPLYFNAEKTEIVKKYLDEKLPRGLFDEFEREERGEVPQPAPESGGEKRVNEKFESFNEEKKKFILKYIDSYREILKLSFDVKAEELRTAEVENEVRNWYINEYFRDENKLKYKVLNEEESNIAVEYLEEILPKGLFEELKEELKKESVATENELREEIIKAFQEHRDSQFDYLKKDLEAEEKEGDEAKINVAKKRLESRQEIYDSLEKYGLPLLISHVEKHKGPSIELSIKNFEWKIFNLLNEFEEKLFSPADYTFYLEKSNIEFSTINDSDSHELFKKIKSRQQDVDIRILQYFLKQMPNEVAGFLDSNQTPAEFFETDEFKKMQASMDENLASFVFDEYKKIAEDRSPKREKEIIFAPEQIAELDDFFSIMEEEYESRFVKPGYKEDILLSEAKEAFHIMFVEDFVSEKIFRPEDEEKITKIILGRISNRIKV